MDGCGCSECMQKLSPGKVVIRFNVGCGQLELNKESRNVSSIGIFLCYRIVLSYVSLFIIVCCFSGDSQKY